MKYTPKYFKDNFPAWKKKKDSILVRTIHRPISFAVASLMSNLNISANTVSYFSLVLAVSLSVMYLFDGRIIHIVAAVLVNVWMILDCTDGNIARSVKKEKFGEFADGISSYILINFMFICIGFTAYRTDGFFISAGNVYVIMLGILAGNSDAMARLIYQKFQNTSFKLSPKSENVENNQEDDKENLGTVRKIQDRLDKELGLNGLLLPAILIFSIIDKYDILLMIYALWQSFLLTGTLAVLIRKTIIANKDSESE